MRQTESNPSVSTRLTFGKLVFSAIDRRFVATMASDASASQKFVRLAAQDSGCEVRAVLSPVQGGPLRYQPPPEARKTSQGGCPVVHHANADAKDTSDDGAPKRRDSNDSGCPMHEKEGVNARNMMPPPNQTQDPMQRSKLPTERMVSSIPMGNEKPHHQDEGERWQYPSQQMFYNAMKRKGWDPKEEDMPAVVAIHNTVNERVWEEIRGWEKRHEKECDCPKLLRFRGRPKDYSPKARIMNFLGYKLPFDRHDWIVDRCGKEVRYVIDFYNSKPAFGIPIAMYMDVRPALDQSQNVWDRLMMQANWMFSLRWLKDSSTSSAETSKPSEA